MAEDSLLREVDADLRAERMHQFWRRYRMPLLIAVVVLVAITAGTSIRRDMQARANGEAMIALDTAIAQFEAGDASGAAGKFKAIAQDANGELHDIALLWQARAEAGANDAGAAVKTLTELASDPAGDDLVWRDLACLRLLSANVETPKACAAGSESPLKSQRLEWQAALLWQQGKVTEARDLLSTIVNDETAPPSQRQRARQLLRTLPAKAA